jgi:hypothetical protein
MVIKVNTFSTFREEIFETCGAGKVGKQDPATAWTRVESLGVVACSLVITALIHPVAEKGIDETKRR